MQALADSLIRSWFDADPATWPYTQVFYAGVMIVAGSVVFGIFGAFFGGFISWLERKVAGRMQSRIGPNRAGPMGILVWMADGLKNILKEDLIPEDADVPLFKLGPYLVLLGMVLSLVALPFGAHLVIADMNVGLFYIAAVASLEVVGVLVSGWASNSKWAVLGGWRSAAQIVSYEIPFALSLMVVILSAGTMSTVGVVEAQGAMPWDWYLFRSPMHFTAFFIYAIASLAEGNRTPFDLPEAEQELVSGFNTEYSGLRFASYFLAEFANVYIMNALGVVLFLGGWLVPGIESYDSAGAIALSVLVFQIKAWVGVFVVLWIRWTLPRIRIDQMMDLCWKYLVPIGIALVVLTGLYEVLLHDLEVVRRIISGVLLLGALVLLVRFVNYARNAPKAMGDTITLTENW